MANPTTVGALRVLLTADTAEFSQAMTKAGEGVQGRLDGIRTAITDALKPLGGAGNVLTTIGAAAAGAMAVLADQALRYADELKTAQQRTGATVEGLQQLRYVAAATGTEFGSVTRTLESLQDRIGKGNKGLVGAIAELGLNFEDIRKMPIDQAFLKIQEALRAVGSDTDRARLQTDLFGTSWRDAAKVIEADTAQIAADTLRMSQQQVDALDRATESVKGFFSTAIDQMKTFTGQALADAWRGVERTSEVIRYTWNRATGDMVAANAVVLESMRRDGKLIADAADTNFVQPVKTYVAQLSAAKKEVRDLTAEQRNQIRAAIDLGKSIKAIAEATGLSEDAVRLYKEEVQQADREHKRMTTEAQRDQKKVEEGWRKWQVLLQGLTVKTFPDMTEAYKRSTGEMVRAMDLVENGMRINVTKIGDSLDEGDVDLEAYKAGMEKWLGLAGEKAVSFRDTMKGAFTDIQGIVTSTLQGMVDDFFDKFGILGNILSGFVNNAITWFSDWAFAALGWGKSVSESARGVVDAVNGAAEATVASAAKAATSLATWLSVFGVIGGIVAGIVAFFKLLPSGPGGGASTPNPILDDPAKKAPEPGDDFGLGGPDPRGGFAFGTPNLDFVPFGRGSMAALHGDEAVIPRGSGHQLAAEIAAALGGSRGGASDRRIVIENRIYLDGQQLTESTIRRLEQNDSGGAPVSIQSRFGSLVRQLG